jgi:predicted RNase H-related nuclease YkuK (DUF458 family)
MYAEDKIWTEANNSEIKYSLDEVFSLLKKNMESNLETDTKLMIGTDSHRQKHMYHFVTVIGIWNVGRGGTYFHCSTLEPKKNFGGSQKMRLHTEVLKSIEIALICEEHIKMKPEIHIDASPEEVNNFSSSFSEMLKGYVISNGYNAILKPNSFMANTIADKHTRIKKVKKRKKWIENSLKL